MSLGDYHLDPPDEYEGPECPVESCEGMGDYPRLSPDAAHDIFTCDECGHEWSLPHQKDWGDQEEVINAMHVAMCDEFQPERDPICPHGNTWGECGSCDYLGDLAFDAARERGWR